MAGFGAGYALETAGVPFVCYDRNSYYGGHTHSLRYDSGFVFDEGGHLSFTKHDHVKDLLAENVDGRYEERKLKIDNYWHGYRIPHPVQTNLRNLPTDVIISVIKDFVAVQGRELNPTGSYADWLLDTYGKTFAETFPLVYGHKYHTTTMDQLTTDWVGPRMYRPVLDEVLRGALGGEVPGAHYVSISLSLGRRIRELSDAFARRFELRLNHQLTGLDPKAKVLWFVNGKAETYDTVIRPFRSRAHSDDRRVPAMCWRRQQAGIHHNGARQPRHRP